MKIRTDFVSNSSSSSFLIEKERTTAQVALEMIRIVHAEYKDQWGDDVERLDRYVSHMDWLRKHQDFDKNISITYTCNYETFIYREDGTIRVDTCNNHDWWHDEAMQDMKLKDIDEYEDDDVFPRNKDMKFFKIQDLADGTENEMTKIKILGWEDKDWYKSMIKIRDEINVDSDKEK